MGLSRKLLSPRIGSVLPVLLLLASVTPLPSQQESSGEGKEPLTLLTMAIPEHPFAYQQVSEAGQIEIAGIDIDLIERFAEELGRGYVVKNFKTLETMFVALEEGQGDLCAAGLAITKKRSARGLVSDPYYYSPGKVTIVGRRDQHYESIDSLKGTKISVLAGSVFQEVLETQVPTAALLPSQLHHDNLLAVQEGHADFTLMAISDVRHYFETQSDLEQDLEIKGELDVDLAVGVFFSKSEPELVPLFNEWLARMEAGGELGQIIKAHF